MSLDLRKKIQNIRNPGSAVTYVGTLRDGRHAIEFMAGQIVYYSDQSLTAEFENAPEKVTRYLNMYKHGTQTNCVTWDSVSQAEFSRKHVEPSNWLGAIEVTIEGDRLTHAEVVP